MSTPQNLLPFHKQFPDKLRSETIFGQYEKIYRRPPSFKKNSKEFIKLQSEEKIKLKKVVDFKHINKNHEIHQKNIKLISTKNNLKMYGYSEFDGLYFIPNYLSISEQFEWIKQSIKEFSNAPYNNLTNLYKQQNKDISEIATWEKAIKNNNFDNFRQLTWSNIGIQYDWTQRKYNLENVTAKIPKTMLKLCQDCNNLLSQINDDKIDDDENKEKMQIIPQTAIINFFKVNTKRPMGGHRDAAELVNAPLISISLGNEAIFLISKHDNIEPLPIWIRSGDILIMSKKIRFALHSVARVCQNTCPKQLIQYFDQQQINNQNKEIQLMKKYIMESRINFNIRQVIDIETKQPDFFHEIHSF